MGVRVDLLVMTILSLALVPLVIFWGGSLLSLVVGLIFALFIPGYMLVAALFPKRNDLDGARRLALSFGLSIAVIPLIGLILNYTLWGVSLYPVVVSILVFIVVAAGIAWYRRRRLPQEERFEPHFRPRLWWGQNRWDRALLGLLLVVIIGAIGVLVYVTQPPTIEDRFTEFYILGQGGKAVDYPDVLVLGEKATVVIGIVNREQQVTEYNVKILIDGQGVGEVKAITLAQEEKWEQPVSFAPIKVGEDQMVEFQLYREGDSKAYRALDLWVNVVGSK
jgi:uncharacterized membrane protein